MVIEGRESHQNRFDSAAEDRIGPLKLVLQASKDQTFDLERFTNLVTSLQQKPLFLWAKY